MCIGLTICSPNFPEETHGFCCWFFLNHSKRGIAHDSKLFIFMFITTYSYVFMFNHISCSCLFIFPSNDFLPLWRLCFALGPGRSQVGKFSGKNKDSKINTNLTNKLTNKMSKLLAAHFETWNWEGIHGRNQPEWRCKQPK